MKAKLPPPDEFGNYWLGEDHQYDAAIFPSKLLKNGKVVRVASTYYATLGRERGWLMDGLVVRTFPTPADALAALVKAGW